jgi:hypothetical protein
MVRPLVRALKISLISLEDQSQQALNDFVIVGVTAGAAFSAGALVENLGSYGLNLAVVPPLVVVGLILGLAGLSRTKSPRPSLGWVAAQSRVGDGRGAFG